MPSHVAAAFGAILRADWWHRARVNLIKLVALAANCLSQGVYHRVLQQAPKPRLIAKKRARQLELVQIEGA